MKNYYDDFYWKTFYCDLDYPFLLRKHPAEYLHWAISGNPRPVVLIEFIPNNVCCLKYPKPCQKSEIATQRCSVERCHKKI